MSARPDRSRDVEGALDSHIHIEEKSEWKAHKYPADIVDQLKKAAFVEGETANTYVKRINPTNDSNDLKVVTVEIYDDSLVIDVEDIVGIVNLTPNSTLQIDPKSGISWDDILEMFLTVGEQRRSLEYRGIPIREFLADDIGIEDIFIVVAVNYLNSLEDIFRHGFIRSFNQRRIRALDARGRIDITNSLINFDLPNDVPKHEFVQKTVEYSVPVNDVIYKAGQEVQRLFYLYSDKETNPGFTRIFSRLDRAMQRLENRGITGESVTISDIPSITIESIPRQRHYYAQALEISKTILSSSIGKPLDEGREELLMEYILSVDSLFEEYCSLILEKELDKLKQNPMIAGLEDVTIEKESYQLFEDDDVNFSSHPDHVIKSAGQPIAVLDSKYYGKDKNPLKGSWARSRLLSYGFHLETENLGMITPLAPARSYKFAGRSGKLSIISPEDDEFSTDGLRIAIQQYLRDHVGEPRQINATTDLQNRPICHPDVEGSVINDVLDEPKLRADQLVGDSRKILEYIVKDARLSDKVNPRDTTPIFRANSTFKKYLRKESEEYDIIIPVFIPADDEEAEYISNDEELIEEYPWIKNSSEFIRIHCFSLNEAGDPIEYHSPPPFGLNW